MALDLGGRRAEADRAYDWLVDLQRADGSWHQYYVADEQGRPRSSRTSSTPTSAPTSPPACGTTGCCTERPRASPRPCGRSSSGPSTSCSTCRRPRGEILWARHADGTPWSFALLTGSSSICHSLRCAIALAELLGHERPDWELSAARLAHTSSPTCPRPSPPSTAGRWTGTTRCSAGVVLGDAGRERLDERRDTFVLEGKGVRCVSDRPWITVAETCECALAHLAVGERRHRRGAVRAGRSSSATRTAATGPAPSSPSEAHFPGGERSTYTAAAVVLAADALAGQSPGVRALRRPRQRPARSLIDLLTPANPSTSARSRVRNVDGSRLRSGGGPGGCRPRRPPRSRPDSRAGR